MWFHTCTHTRIHIHKDTKWNTLLTNIWEKDASWKRREKKRETFRVNRVKLRNTLTLSNIQQRNIAFVAQTYIFIYIKWKKVRSLKLTKCYFKFLIFHSIIYFWCHTIHLAHFFVAAFSTVAFIPIEIHLHITVFSKVKSEKKKKKEREGERWEGLKLKRKTSLPFSSTVVVYL